MHFPFGVIYIFIKISQMIDKNDNTNIKKTYSKWNENIKNCILVIKRR